MNRHERRALAKVNAKANAKAGKPAPALAVLHASVLRHALDGRFLEALSTCQQALALDPDNADTMHLMAW